MSLNGPWELAGFAPGQGDWAGMGPPYPIPITIPGEVHLALEAAGVLDDLFYADNAAKVQWVDTREWWFRRTFECPPDFQRTRTFLEFDGLDTFATIIVNGRAVGESANSFTPCRLDVTDAIRSGTNELEVRFASTRKLVEAMDLDGYYVRYNPLRIGARKAQIAFGWDLSPELLGAGICRDARLRAVDELSIRDVHIKPSLMGDRAEASMSVEIENHTGITVGADVTLRLCGHGLDHAESLTVSVSPDGCTVEAVVDIREPRLWWPSGLGDQPMYAASVELSGSGRLLDRRDQPFAIRKVELIREDNQGKTAFGFVINDQPVFVCGANWVTADYFLTRAAPERYEELLNLARDAHITMLRVWGGGSYENEAFYDLCDRLGIMLWHDFMFALAEYPETPEFVGLVDAEARGVVRRLRHHPSIVLWCGNNECRMDDPADMDWFGKRLFMETIPKVAQELDGTRPYWPSSPYGGPKPSSPADGDFHGEPYFKFAAGLADDHVKAIYDETGLFMSEFPTLGPPERESLERFIPPGDLFPPQDNPVWNMHLWNNTMREEKEGYSGQEMLMRLIRKGFGDPQNVDDFCRMGGLGQGEWLHAQLGHYRRCRYDIRGAMLWMFGEPWPSVGYSIVDYYLRPKPAYHFVRRAFAPVAAVVEPDEPGATMGAWVVNDRRERVQGVMRLAQVPLPGGEPVWLDPLPFDVPAGQCRQLWTSPLPEDPSGQVMVAITEIGGREVARAHLYEGMARDLRLPKPRLDVSTRTDGPDGLVTVRTDAFAYAVALEGLPDLARPEDSYFDLLPGEERTIRIARATPADLERLRVVAGL